MIHNTNLGTIKGRFDTSNPGSLKVNALFIDTIFKQNEPFTFNLNQLYEKENSFLFLAGFVRR